VHILTKAFMVLATLLAILLSGLVIAYAANTDRIRADYVAMQTAVATKDSALATTGSVSGATISRLQGDLQGRDDQNSRLQGQITSLQDEKSQLQIDKDRAVADRLTTENKISELSELARTQATLLENYRNEVTGLRKNELTAKSRMLEFEDRINDLQAQRDVLDQNYRALQEEIAQLKRDGQLTGGATGLASAPEQPWQNTGPLIMGRIESLQRDPATNRVMAKISVGSNDRVAKNMLMRIVRNNEFVANVVVTQADLSYSIGAIDTLGKTVEVREGDTVVSRLQ
jgi:hypothetical protein